MFMITNENDTANLRLFDGTHEKSPSERKNRLGALEHESGFEHLCREFAYQLHLSFEQKILDPKTSSEEREVLVKARAIACERLHPERLVSFGVKRAESVMKRLDSESTKNAV